MNSAKDQRDQIHDELKHVLTKLREKRELSSAKSEEPTKFLPFEIQTWNEKTKSDKIDF